MYVKIEDEKYYTELENFDTIMPEEKGYKDCETVEPFYTPVCVDNILDTDSGIIAHDNTDDNLHLQPKMEIPTSELMSTDEKWKLIFSEQTREPLFAVGHYINHLKKQIDEKGQKQKSKKLKDGIHPLSYLLRKLKLDLKMSYESFVSEFVRIPSNGLIILVRLLKQLQSPSRSKSTSVSGKESRLEEYKRQLADEHDCLLCIKFTLRSQMAVTQLIQDEDNLHIIAASLMSSTIRSRVVTLEILTLSLNEVGGFDRVFDTFTNLRIKYGESVRFKVLISMLLTKGYGQIIFQLSAMRFLNTLLSACRSANLKVYIQEEIRMAGLDTDLMEKFTRGDGLEYDDLKKEIDDWNNRLIDVDNLLKKPKTSLWCKSDQTEFKDKATPNNQQHRYSSHDSRKLPPVPVSNLAEIPQESIHLLIDILQNHQQDQSRRISTGDLKDDDDIRDELLELEVTSDYNTDQENYIAHVYKNTQTSAPNKNYSADPQFRRSSADFGQSKKHQEENIYETLNTRPSTLDNDEFFDPVGLVLNHQRKNSTKRLGSLNGNWVLRTHLSMPSLNDSARLPYCQDNYQTKTAKNGRFFERVGEPDGAMSSEPYPDYSPEMTPSHSVKTNTKEAFSVLNEFDQMLDKHEIEQKVLALKQSDYIAAGTITYV